MWVSEKEKLAAKEYDVYEYLRIADPGELVKICQGEYCLRSHDSFKISHKDGKWLWYWYSRGIGGRSAVDYLIKVKDYTFVDAIKEVNRAMKGMKPSFFVEEKEKKAFSLPSRSRTNDKVIGYLCSRGIDKSLIEDLIAEKMIYQNHKHQSVVFVGFDDQGKPAHASYRATGISSVKGDFGGSNKAFAFRLEKENADTVRVFESAIDLLSYVTLCRMWDKDYSHESLISTAGIAATRHDEVKLPMALEYYLERHLETENVLLHFDNDYAGRRCASQIKEKLKEAYRVKFIKPKKGKDYNEYLMIEKGMRKEEKSCNCR